MSVTTRQSTDAPIKLDCGYTWDLSPSWWNFQGEPIYKLEGDQVWLAYWASPIHISALRLVEGAAQ